MLPFQVRDSENHILFSKEDASKGKFAFTTDNYDMFEVCLESQVTVAGESCEAPGCWVHVHSLPVKVVVSNMGMPLRERLLLI